MHRCSEQIRRKAVTQSYGATAGHTATARRADSEVRWRLFRVRHSPATQRSRTASGGFMRTTFYLAVALAVATSTAVQGQTGNGPPNGSHYNLKILRAALVQTPNMA